MGMNKVWEQKDKPFGLVGALDYYCSKGFNPFLFFACIDIENI